MLQTFKISFQKPVIEQIRAEVKSLNLAKDFQTKKQSGDENDIANCATSDISKSQSGSPCSAISGDKSHGETSDYEEKSPESTKPKDLIKGE